MTDSNGQATFMLYMGTNAKDAPDAIDSEVKIVGTYAASITLGAFGEKLELIS